MKLAIMQPYLFPYIGYFQLVNAVDKFVFYDDVQYIKRGWINRNYILERGERKLLITLHLDKSSVKKKINEIRVEDNSKKIIKTIKQNYSKAPFFDSAFPLVEKVFKLASSGPLISEIASTSICEVSRYLGLKTNFLFSSGTYPETLGFGREGRPISICKIEGAEIIANPIGGENLYNKDDFRQAGVALFFLKTNEVKYPQFKNKFVPNLSIIDVIMFNPKEQIISLLNNYELK